MKTAYEQFDDWCDNTGVIRKKTSYYYEFISFLDEQQKIIDELEAFKKLSQSANRKALQELIVRQKIIDEQAAEIAKLDEALAVLLEAVGFYASTEHWEYIPGHTKWCSNLNVEDCAMYNAGGGRARMAKAKALKILEEKA